MISLARVDERLVHGQVIEAWLPHLRAKRIVVADDGAFNDSLAQQAMAMAIPHDVELVITGAHSDRLKTFEKDNVATLLLFRTVKDACEAALREVNLKKLNLGNVHAKTGSTAVAPTVYLSNTELDSLHALQSQGTEVVCMAVPNDAPKILK